MSDHTTPEKNEIKKRNKLRKLVKWCTAIVSILIACLIIAVIALPAFVSSNYAANMIRKTASEKSGGILDFKNLTFTYKNGVTITGLTFESSKKDLPLTASIKRLHADVSWKKLISRVASFSTEIDEADIRYKKPETARVTSIKPGASENIPENKQPPEPREEIAGKSPGDKAFLLMKQQVNQAFNQLKSFLNDINIAVPYFKNIEGKCAIANTRIEAEDAVSGSVLSLSDIDIKVDMPSMTAAPLTLTADARPSLNEVLLAPVKIGVKAENWVHLSKPEKGSNAGFVITPSKSALDMNIIIPGARVETRAKPGAPELVFSLDTDLKKAYPVIAPFISIPEKFKDNLSGQITVKISVSGESIIRVSASVNGGNIKNSIMETPLSAGAELLCDLSIEKSEIRVGNANFSLKSAGEPIAEVTGGGSYEPGKGDASVDIHINSAPLLKAAAPFLPHLLPPSFLVSGDVHVKTTVSGDIGKKIDFGTQINISGLEAVHTPLNMVLGKETIGKADIVLDQSGFFDPATGMIELGAANPANVDIRLGGEPLTHLNWSVKANANLFKMDNFSISNLYLDTGLLSELVSEALPENMRLRIAAKNDEKARISAGSLSLIMDPKTKDHSTGKFAVNDLKIKCPEMSYTDPSNNAAVSGLNLNVKSGEVFFRNFFPEAASWNASLSMERAGMIKPAVASLKNLSFENARIVLSDIGLTPGVGAGFTGNLSWDAKITVKDVLAQAGVSADLFTCGVSGEMKALNSGNIDFNHVSFETTLYALKLEDVDKAPITGGLRLKVIAPDITMKLKDIENGAFGADLKPVTFSLEADDWLNAEMTVSGENLVYAFSDKGKSPVNSGIVRISSHITADAGKAWMPEGVKSKFNLKGRFGGGLEASLRPPEQSEIKALLKAVENRTPPLADFLEKVELTATLQDLSAKTDISEYLKPTGDADRPVIFAVSGFRSIAPLKLRLDKNLAALHMTGDMKGAFHTENLLTPYLEKGSGVENTPINLQLTFDTRLNNLSGVDTSWTILLDNPVMGRFADTLSLNIISPDRDKFFEIIKNPSAPLNLDGWDIRVGMLLDADIKHLKTAGTSPVSFKGAVTNDFSLSLSKGRTLIFKNAFKTNIPEIIIPGTAEIKTISGSIGYEKRFGLTYAADSEKTKPSNEKNKLQSHLTNDVLSASSPAIAGLAASEAPQNAIRGWDSYTHFSEDADNYFRIESIGLPAGKLPITIELSKTEIIPITASILPGVKSFKTDLFGGTVLGFLNIAENSNEYLIFADTAFTGINPAKVSNSENGKTDQDKEISGEASISFALPKNITKDKTALSVSNERFLNSLNAKLDLTHIGGKFLENLLTTLDPYGSNETVHQQKKLVANGSPEYFIAEIRNGGISVNGSVSVKGVSIALPRVERIALTQMNLIPFDIYEPALGLVRILDAYSSNILVIDPPAGVRFIR